MLSIVAPYMHNEVTAAAISLADLCNEYGHPVSLISSSRIQKGMSPEFWDKQVKNIEHLYSDVSDSVLFVGVEPSVVDTYARINSDASIGYVLPPHSFHVENIKFLDFCDVVFVPSSRTANAVHMLRRDCGFTTPLCVKPIRFTSSFVPVRTSMHFGKVLFLADQEAIDFNGRNILTILENVLDRVAGLSVTLQSYKAWPREQMRTIATLAAKYPSRFDHVFDYRESTTVTRLVGHGCVLILNSRSNFGYNVSRACFFSPVVAYNIPPFSDFVISETNGILLTCKQGESPTTLGTSAVVNVKNSSRKVVDILETGAYQHLCLEDYAAARKVLYNDLSSIL